MKTVLQCFWYFFILLLIESLFLNPIETNVDSSYSTFHVLNILLRAQVDDLIKIGVDSIFKVNFKIW